MHFNEKIIKDICEIKKILETLKIKNKKIFRMLVKKAEIKILVRNKKGLH